MLFAIVTCEHPLTVMNSSSSHVTLHGMTHIRTGTIQLHSNLLHVCTISYSTSLHRILTTTTLALLLRVRCWSSQVRPEHFPLVGNALIATLRNLLGEEFTAEIESSWVILYELLSKIMVRHLDFSCPRFSRFNTAWLRTPTPPQSRYTHTHQSCCRALNRKQLASTKQRNQALDRAASSSRTAGAPLGPMRLHSERGSQGMLQPPTKTTPDVRSAVYTPLLFRQHWPTCPFSGLNRRVATAQTWAEAYRYHRTE